MRVCKYLNQKVRRTGEWNGKSFKGFTKTKKKKKYMKRLSLITQFKIEFLLPFIGCRKVLGKMPEVTCFQKVPDFSLRKIRILGTLLPTKFDLSSIAINSTAFLNI